MKKATIINSRKKTGYAGKQGTSLRSMLLTGAIAILCLPEIAFAQNGEQLFQQNCQTCHTIGEGDLVGPDLANVNDRREQDWLINFIQSSQSMVENGDETAVKVFEDYNSIVMPDQNLSGEQITAILSYIESSSPAQASTSTSSSSDTAETTAQQEKQPAKPAIPPADSATEEDINEGKLLFTGQKRLANKGPSCISCHHVNNDNIIAGGGLARELTNSFQRAGGDAGITAILKNPPFPVMKEAYKKDTLSKAEIFKLKAYLKHAQEEQYYQIPRDYRARMLGYGIVGVAVLLGLFGMLWSKRRKKSVNQEIMDRQIKSTTSW